MGGHAHQPETTGTLVGDQVKEDAPSGAMGWGRGTLGVWALAGAEAKAASSLWMGAGPASGVCGGAGTCSCRRFLGLRVSLFDVDVLEPVFAVCAGRFVKTLKSAVSISWVPHGATGNGRAGPGPFLVS